MSILHLDKMTWTDVESLDRLKSIFFLPISPIEEHGPHLPLGTDFFGAGDMLDLALQKLESKDPMLNYVALPGIPVGSTGSTMDFPGTISVRGKTLMYLIEDICKSIARHGFKYFIISNHHLDLIHVKAIHEAIDKVKKKYNINIYEPAASYYYSDNPPEIPLDLGVDIKKEIHADAKETSYIMYKYPELLRDNYKDLPQVYVNITENLRKGIRTFRGMGAESGYIGTPANASAEYGRLHIENGADIIADSAIKLYRGEKLPEMSKTMLFVIKKVNKAPRRKRTGYQKLIGNFPQQAAGN